MLRVLTSSRNFVGMHRVGFATVKLMPKRPSLLQRTTQSTVTSNTPHNFDDPRDSPPGDWLGFEQDELALAAAGTSTPASAASSASAAEKTAYVTEMETAVAIAERTLARLRQLPPITQDRNLSPSAAANSDSSADSTATPASIATTAARRPPLRLTCTPPPPLLNAPWRD